MEGRDAGSNSLQMFIVDQLHCQHNVCIFITHFTSLAYRSTNSDISIHDISTGLYTGRTLAVKQAQLHSSITCRVIIHWQSNYSSKPSSPDAKKHQLASCERENSNYLCIMRRDTQTRTFITWGTRTPTNSTVDYDNACTANHSSDRSKKYKILNVC